MFAGPFMHAQCFPAQIPQRRLAFIITKISWKKEIKIEYTQKKRNCMIVPIPGHLSTQSNGNKTCARIRGYHERAEAERNRRWYGLVARRVDLLFFLFFLFFSFCFLEFLHDICHDGCLKETTELRGIFLVESEAAIYWTMAVATGRPVWQPRS